MRSLILTSIASGILFAGYSSGFTQEVPPSKAVSTPAMKGQFEGLYEAWREAWETRDFEAWKQVTAQARQGEIRNQVVSQKQPYPEALFSSPLRAPEIDGLIHVDTLVRTDTASAVYFGKANFGVSDGVEISNNFIVLRFVKEFGVWKYDNLRVVKFGDDPEVLLKLRNRDHSFLEAAEFQPDLKPPKIPGQVNRPDYIAEIWLTAVGYEAKITVNGQHHSAIANDSGRELINGGLVKGSNRISVEVTEIPVDDRTPRHFEIGIYGAANPNDEAERFYHYRATAETTPENYQKRFVVPGS